MYDYKTALEQEWAVFRALAPQELIDLILAPNLDHEMRNSLETMLIELGFHELSMEYCHRKGSDKILQHLLGGQERDTRHLLRLFMDNIQSEELHKLFDQRVGYLY